jgi:hypothetical protein
MEATARELYEQQSGVKLEEGVGYEVAFKDLDSTITRVKNKVGLKTSMTEFFRAARRHSFAENPIAPNQADIVKWILYDRFQFAPGTTVPNNFKFFTQPIGTAGKTKIDTNMDQVQRLSDPLWFNTEGLGFWFGSVNLLSDISAFFQSEYMEFWVGQKVYLEGPIQCFPGGAGLQGYSDGVTGGQQTWTNGQARTDNVYDVRLPAGIHLGVDANNVPIVTDGLIGVTILQGQQFRVEMNAPMGGAALAASTATPAGTGLTVMAYLYGILSRGVQ